MPVFSMIFEPMSRPVKPRPVSILAEYLLFSSVTKMFVFAEDLLVLIVLKGALPAWIISGSIGANWLYAIGLASAV